MMARPYYMVVALLLLAEFTRFGEGTPNPGFMVRITGKGLEYAHQYGVATLKNDLSTIKLPDLSGSYGIGWLGSVNYVFSGMRIHHFLLRNSQLSLHPSWGLPAPCMRGSSKRTPRCLYESLKSPQGPSPRPGELATAEGGGGVSPARLEVRRSGGDG